MNFKKEVEKTKKDNSSFIGIDGGKINREVWFCGIEFGGNLKEMEEYYKDPDIRFDSMTNTPPYRTGCPTNYLDSKYDRMLSAMYINLFEPEKLINGNNTKPIVEVLKNKLYSKESKLFKLNLYPLAKKNDGKWDENITAIYGIEKDDYYGKYFDKRKEFFKKLNEKFRPVNKSRKIICTTVKNSEYKFPSIVRMKLH
jgi:hypothetical protein